SGPVAELTRVPFGPDRMRRIPLPLRIVALLLACVSLPLVAAEPARLSTAGPGVRVFTPPLRMPMSGFARRLRVYLPPGYAEGTRRYPVLYMFDGQNLFDDATSYAGEWGVDEAMDRLAREDGLAVIVVGIDHGNALRIHELIPYANPRFLPNGGAAFIDDVVHAIKPFVEANYRTLPGPQHTAVFGSSLGGLSADYAIHRYPRVFGMAGVFSPSYWVSGEAITVAARERLPAGSRVYLFIGGREGPDAVRQVEDMARVLGMHPGAAKVALRVEPDAAHNEAAWREAFPRAVRWLFGHGDDPRD
ncbi:MAG: alpha/beta hydrolase, partial [Luteimonas sp.]|nr:alpha/beta hydrolase [Luteimonas sp.]